MTELTDCDLINKIVQHTTVPVVIKGVCKWPLLKWTLQDWEKHLNSKVLPFRCKPTIRQSKKPDWESKCPVKKMKMEDFVRASSENGDDWFYFDYKYMHEWFKPTDEVFKHIKWDLFGFPERDAAESTLWIGSNGAHTPCHQDTYGRNIVVQIFGRKLWVLFPPESGGLKPTRVPYEESSIFSQLNFSSPSDIKMFNGLHGARMITLEPGDALIVPPKWWHYVENVSNVAISINSWIQCDDIDVETRVEEALTRLLVAQICKDLPEEKFKSILNPNEDYLSDMPLTVAILQIESSLSEYLKQNSKKEDTKRAKLDHPTSTQTTDACTNDKENIDINNLISDSCNINEVSQAKPDEFKCFLTNNMKKNTNPNPEENTDEPEDIFNQDNLTAAIIDSFCDSSVIKSIKENLINKFT